MAILFPDTAGQATDGSFTHTEGGLTWIWNGSSWRSSGGTLDTYQLPTASTTVLGGVKVDGSTVTIDTNGVIKTRWWRRWRWRWRHQSWNETRLQCLYHLHTRQ